MTMRLSHITSRYDVPSLLNEMGLLGNAVEVGTHRGEYAGRFLCGWNGKMLYCIDPWESTPPEYDCQIPYLECSNGDMSEDYAECLRVMTESNPTGNRFQLIKGLSLDMARVMYDVDFVHIDANHERPYVDRDIAAWWKCLRYGGVMLIHDFICPNENGGGWGVHIQPAAMEFAADVGVDVWVVNELHSQCQLPWSCYLIKG